MGSVSLFSSMSLHPRAFEIYRKKNPSKAKSKFAVAAFCVIISSIIGIVDFIAESPNLFELLDEIYLLLFGIVLYTEVLFSFWGRWEIFFRPYLPIP